MKIKGVLFGVVIGIALTISSSALAESVSKIGKVITNEYAVVLNNSKLPVGAISFEGTSYLPVRVIGEELGLDVTFKNKTISLTTIGDQAKPEEVTQPEQGTSATNEITPPVEVGVISETNFKGVKAVVKDGVIYFSPRDYGLKHNPIAWSYDKANNKLMLNEHESETSTAVIKTFYEIEASEENYIIHNGATYINAKHYKEPSELK